MNGNTGKHISWFREHGVNFVDIGIFNRVKSKMNLKQELRINDLDKIIKFCSYKNSTNHCIYIRPARNYDHNIIVVDDVPDEIMKTIVKKFEAISIRTSREGGFQMWIATDKRLNEQQRKDVQGFIQPYFNSDPNSISGEHFGRCAGFKNHKRGGQWVNVYHVNKNGRRLETEKALAIAVEPTPEPFKSTETQSNSIIIPTAHKILSIQPEAKQPSQDKSILRALEKIDPEDRSSWLKVGAALRSIDRRDLFDNWSRQSNKYNPKVQNKTWNALHNTRTTIGSIFYLAYSEK